MAADLLLFHKRDSVQCFCEDVGVGHGGNPQFPRKAAWLLGPGQGGLSVPVPGGSSA